MIAARRAAGAVFVFVFVFDRNYRTLNRSRRPENLNSPIHR